MRSNHDHGGGDCVKVEEQRPHPKNHDTYKSGGNKSGRHGEAKRKAGSICGGSHGHARCPGLKSLGAIVQEKKKKDAQEQGQGVEKTQLVLKGL